MKGNSTGWRAPVGRILLPVSLALVFVFYTGFLDGNPGVASSAWSTQPLHLFANALPGLL